MLLAFGVPTTQADGPTTQPIRNFVRYVDDGKGGGKMQTAFASYRDDDGVTVDLLASMHIGDKPFYKDLVGRFSKYDAVLYELVNHRGQPAVEEGVNPQQAKIAADMRLDNQGPHINYQRDNFVHADLDLETIKKLEIQKHGTFKGALGEGPGLKAAKSQEDTAGDKQVFDDLEAAKTAKGPEKIRLMRRAYARILELTNLPTEGQTVPRGMEVLAGARNDKVMEVFKDQAKAGKKKLAVLYGAAHMVDLEDRLFKAGFTRQTVEWVTVWTVSDEETAR